MAFMVSLPSQPKTAIVPLSRECFGCGAALASLAVWHHKNGCAFGQKLYSPWSFVNVAEPHSIKHFKRVAWKIRSSVDNGGLDPSAPSNSGGTRLVRAIQALQTRLGARIQEIRKNLPMKLLFFLVGFYCATAFSTVIGQTGDWDILSAALAVVVVEGIGALMYGASLTLVNNIRSLITMFNYWKAGLTLGLFLDSFKYEIDRIMSFSVPFYFEMDIFDMFL